MAENLLKTERERDNETIVGEYDGDGCGGQFCLPCMHYI